MTENESDTRRSRHLRVPVFPEEAARIEASADEAGYSVAAFLRAVGQGYRVWSVVDYERVDDLLRVNADLGRLGGLLKMWLSDDDRLAEFDDEQMPAMIREVLTRIDSTQDELRDIARRVLRHSSS